MTSTLIAYRTPPMMERKAATEARQAGHRAYVPTELKAYKIGSTGKTAKRRVPVAPGYVFADGKPCEAKHIKGRIGSVPRSELARIYPRRDRGNVAPVAPFAPEDRVAIQRGPFAKFVGTVLENAGKRGWKVEVTFFGRPIEVVVATAYMRKHDPG